MMKERIPISGDLGSKVKPVSYTHLDVYKRQVIKTAPKELKEKYQQVFA